jgi:hypothetical protein
MAPSAPGFPRPRESATRPASRREHQSFDGHDSGFLTLAAVATFQEVITFGGRPDSIVIDSTAAGINIRFRNRGEAPRNPIRLDSIGEKRFELSAEIVEAQDPTGAGGQIITATGRWASRGIDTRNNYPGPSRERPQFEAEEARTQIHHGE